MTKEAFKEMRKKLEKTQKQMAQLLGTSIKAVHSYEQGWRSVPVSVERQVYFLITHQNDNSKKRKNCWTIKKCPLSRKRMCPAWEFHSGKVCWFINGTVCGGVPQKNWREKMEMCRKCEAFGYHF